MLNMQQTVLNQVSGTDQPQEEIQLTELLPVKQSRIRANNIFKDVDATDALKALRSFSGGCTEEQDFGLQSFTFCGKVDKHGTKHQRAAHQRKQVNSHLKPFKAIAVKLKSKLMKEGNPEVQEIERKKSQQSADKKGLNRSKRPKSKPVRLDKRRNNLADRNERQTVSLKLNEKDDLKKEVEFYESEEGSMYLNFDKSKDCFNDEVYVFRREPLDPCSPSETDEREVVNSENASENGFYENEYSSTTDGTLFDCTVQRRRNHVDSTDTNRTEGDEDKVDAAVRSTESAQQIKDNSEKELRLKIDAIIQANLLVERENNNVVGTDRNKVLEESSSSSPVPSSTIEGEALDVAINKSGILSEGCEENKEDLREENFEKKYCCVVCDARFKGSGGLRNHYKVVHGAGPIFKCDECGKEFPLKERLKLHVRTHTGFKPYKCPECDKSFARGGQLVQHRRTHSQVKPYRCALCSGTFTCAANLALHVKRHNGQKDHKCEICGRGFVRRDALKKHLECLHRDVKSFLCVICNKTFKGHLPQHMRTHARDRPHGCATCGQRFAQKSQLTVHQRTHSGQRPFRCLVCWQAFAHSTALKLHTRRHTGERPFKCAECNAGFTQLPHWKKHMKCIHGRNEPYSCKRCNSFFRIKNDLESHEKICHPENQSEVEGIGVNGVRNEGVDKGSSPSRYRVMTVERMRLLLAVLLKRISRQERLDELGFGKRLIDEVLQDSLISAGKDPATGEGLSELETLSKNLETFLEWTVPKEHWENFRKMKKTPEDILETLTAT